MRVKILRTIGVKSGERPDLIEGMVADLGGEVAAALVSSGLATDVFDEDEEVADAKKLKKAMKSGVDESREAEVMTRAREAAEAAKSAKGPSGSTAPRVGSFPSAAQLPVQPPQVPTEAQLAQAEADKEKGKDEAKKPPQAGGKK